MGPPYSLANRWNATRTSWRQAWSQPGVLVANDCQYSSPEYAYATSLAWATTGSQWRVRSEEAAAEQERLEQLRSLGYIQ